MSWREQNIIEKNAWRRIEYCARHLHQLLVAETATYQIRKWMWTLQIASRLSSMNCNDLECLWIYRKYFPAPAASPFLREKNEQHLMMLLQRILKRALTQWWHRTFNDRTFHVAEILRLSFLCVDQFLLRCQRRFYILESSIGWTLFWLHK